MLHNYFFLSDKQQIMPITTWCLKVLSNSSTRGKYTVLPFLDEDSFASITIDENDHIVGFNEDYSYFFLDGRTSKEDVYTTNINIINNWNKQCLRNLENHYDYLFYRCFILLFVLSMIVLALSNILLNSLMPGIAILFCSVVLFICECAFNLDYIFAKRKFVNTMNDILMPYGLECDPTYIDNVNEYKYNPSIRILTAMIKSSTIV